MELFGYSLQEIYLFGLIIGGIFTLLYILFGDILEGIFEAIPDGVLNPTLIFSFVTIFSATGYLFEKLSPLNSFIVFMISVILALFSVILLNIFVLIPLRSAEESIVFTEDDLKGRLGKVIISIPEDGFGEVVLEGNSGTLSMSAKSFDDDPIPYDKEVLVIDVKESVLYVKAYDSFN
ncbi:NfeD family protein [Bacillus luteolus]|uniref:NfeD family protein n=1 Tax=Litchfieldia luteola TaxID=682179 RepID=A0ABR9QE92_9BACI|nr:NfeD family protein [Cytobacillus luteolus]MBE4906810.1 NfeD family protein [Cytobacillus luteolus]MBP1940536.1 membrane-bound ClpP family serine protease [Cytobacillus luteolus]